MTELKTSRTFTSRTFFNALFSILEDTAWPATALPIPSTAQIHSPFSGLLVSRAKYSIITFSRDRLSNLASGTHLLFLPFPDGSGSQQRKAEKAGTSRATALLPKRAPYQLEITSGEIRKQ